MIPRVGMTILLRPERIRRTVVHPATELSSRPERSAAEGPVAFAAVIRLSSSAKRLSFGFLLVPDAKSISIATMDIPKGNAVCQSPIGCCERYWRTRCALKFLFYLGFAAEEGGVCLASLGASPGRRRAGYLLPLSEFNFQARILGEHDFMSASDPGVEYHLANLVIGKP